MNVITPGIGLAAGGSPCLPPLRVMCPAREPGWNGTARHGPPSSYMPAPERKELPMALRPPICATTNRTVHLRRWLAALAVAATAVAVTAAPALADPSPSMTANHGSVNIAVKG